jgi:hypothetical protein
MGLSSTREFLRQKLPLTWMQVSRDANEGGGALLIWPEELKIAIGK